MKFCRRLCCKRCPLLNRPPFPPRRPAPTAAAPGERLTGLLRKISNEIIARCRAKIWLADVWDGMVERAAEGLEESVACGRAWKAAYIPDHGQAAAAHGAGPRALVRSSRTFLGIPRNVPGTGNF